MFCGLEPQPGPKLAPEEVAKESMGCAAISERIERMLEETECHDTSKGTERSDMSKGQSAVTCGKGQSMLTCQRYPSGEKLPVPAGSS